MLLCSTKETQETPFGGDVETLFDGECAKKKKTEPWNPPKKPGAQYEKKRAEGILLGSGKPSVAPASMPPQRYKGGRG